MKKLYGVLPSIGVQCDGLIERVTAVPSTELLLELSMFPKDTIIALEEIARGEKACVGDKEVSSDEVASPYFYKLVEHCKMNHHDVVFLDDTDLLGRQADIALRVQETAARFAKRGTARNEREFYKAYIEREHFNAIERPQRYLEKMMGCDIALVTQGVAERFVALGQVKAAYAAESYPLGLQAHIETRFSPSTGTYLDAISITSIPPNILIQDPPVGKNIGLVTRMISRIQNAIRNGRVTNRFPDAIGHTDYAVPSRGLFELFIERSDGDGFEAVYHDIHGTTPVVGQMKGDKLYFIRTFEGEARILTGVTGVVEYRAKLRKDGTYRGVCTYGGKSGPFTMSMTVN